MRFLSGLVAFGFCDRMVVAQEEPGTKYSAGLLRKFGSVPAKDLANYKGSKLAEACANVVCMKNGDLEQISKSTSIHAKLRPGQCCPSFNAEGWESGKAAITDKYLARVHNVDNKNCDPVENSDGTLTNIVCTKCGPHQKSRTPADLVGRCCKECVDADDF